MKAVQYRKVGGQPEVVEIEQPKPGPGQVLLKVTAAGLCHSDQFIMSLPESQYTFGLPLTLGHEGAGVVAALGDGLEYPAVGDAVAVYGPWGCGRCIKCSEGKENYCVNAQRLGIHPPGLGAAGAMAEYLLVDSPRHLIPLGDLDPVKNVSLTDAGLTPYHAIKNSIMKLGRGQHGRRHRDRWPGPRRHPDPARDYRGASDCSRCEPGEARPRVRRWRARGHPFQR